MSKPVGRLSLTREEHFTRMSVLKMGVRMGWSVEQMAERLYMSPTTFRTWFSRLGLTIPGVIYAFRCRHSYIDTMSEENRAMMRFFFSKLLSLSDEYPTKKPDVWGYMKEFRNQSITMK